MPGHDLPLRQVAVADDQVVALFIDQVRPLSHIHGHFVQDGPGEHVLGAIPQDLRQDVPGLDAGIDRALWKRMTDGCYCL